MIQLRRHLSTLVIITAGCLAAACARNVKPTQAKEPVHAPVPEQQAALGYAARPEVQQFIERLVQQDGFDRHWLEQTLSAAHKSGAVLAAIARPYEAKPWYQYKLIFVNAARIAAGVNFWDIHAQELAETERHYGVPASMIVAILGVESFYGRQKGGYSVLDALTTLSFDYPPRAGFFQSELEQYLLMCRERGFDPPALMGSYAGAMGAPQFMPDSYRQYAVTFDGQGQPDIWNDWADILDSVANYFKLHGWQTNGLIAVPAAMPSDVTQTPTTLTPTTVGALRNDGVVLSSGLADATPAILVPLQLEHGMEYWLGLHNFRVILAYNKSPLYGMAVYDLATRIAEARAQEGQNAPP